MHHRGLEHRFLPTTTTGIGGKETTRHRVVAGRRERSLRGVEGVRYLKENPRAVAGARIAPRRAAMGQIGQNFERLRHHGVRRNPFERGHEPEPTRVVLEGGVVETLLGRERHGFSIARMTRRAKSG